MSATRSTPIPELTGRKARCMCGRTTPSSSNLRNFEYRGPGSRSADEVCICGYHQLAHHEDIRSGAVSPTLRKCTGFQPRGDMEYDSYWCGCEPSEDGHPHSAGA